MEERRRAVVAAMGIALIMVVVTSRLWSDGRSKDEVKLGAVRAVRAAAAVVAAAAHREVAEAKAVATKMKMTMRTICHQSTDQGEGNTTTQNQNVLQPPLGWNCIPMKELGATRKGEEHVILKCRLK